MVTVKYLLDTNTCIQLLTNRSVRVKQRFWSHPPCNLKLCSVVKVELEYGARHSQRVTENLALLEKFYVPLESLAFDDLSARQYALIREELACQGKPISHNDLMIAAIAKVHQLTLVTHNTKEFGRVTGLTIEDWEID